MTSDLAAARLALEQGQLDRAEALLQEWLRQHPNNADALERLAIVRARSGDTQGAEVLLHQALQSDPRHRQALTNLGALLQRLGRSSEAGPWLEQATTLHPDHADAWANLAVVRREGGDLTGADAAVRQALKLKADHELALELLLTLGHDLILAEREEEAQAVFEACLAARPLWSEPHALLGALQLKHKRYGEAITTLSTALQLDPSNAAAFSNLSQSLRQQEKLPQALEAADWSLALNPDSAIAHDARGLALRALGRPDEALEAFATSLALAPAEARVIGHRALVLHEQGQLEAANTVIDEAIALEPHTSMWRSNRAYIVLLRSNGQDGWEDYEHRLVTDDHLLHRPSQPRWTPDADHADSLLLIGEQGLGDMIQFARYAPLLRRWAHEVVLCVDRRLVGLLTEAQLADRVCTPEEAESHTGPWLPLLSIFHALGQTPDELAIPVPYLQMSPARIAAWAPRLRRGEELLIGLHWQGNQDAERESNRGRSFPLALLEPLSRLPGLRFVSLQKGVGSEQLASCPFRSAFIEAQDAVDAALDFRDTGAIACCCDLLISSDSGLVHLAGGLGLPVWLLLKHIPDWRWRLEGDTSPWYPSLRLFRQPSPGDWTAAIAQVADALQVWSAAQNWGIRSSSSQS